MHARSRVTSAPFDWVGRGRQPDAAVGRSRACVCGRADRATTARCRCWPRRRPRSALMGYVATIGRSAARTRRQLLLLLADRGGEHPERHLASFAGIVQADAYAGFNRLYDPGRRPGLIVAAGCWAHARRKFYELAAVAQAPLAAEAVRRIDGLFAVEREIDGLPAEVRRAARAERSVPILAELEPWLRPSTSACRARPRSARPSPTPQALGRRYAAACGRIRGGTWPPHHASEGSRRANLRARGPSPTAGPPCYGFTGFGVPAMGSRRGGTNRADPETAYSITRPLPPCRSEHAAVHPQAVQDNRELSRQRHLRPPHAAPPGHLQGPALEGRETAAGVSMTCAAS